MSNLLDSVGMKWKLHIHCALWCDYGHESKKASMEYVPGLDPLQILDFLKRVGLEDWVSSGRPKESTIDLQVVVNK